jgi:Fe-S-cluster containining protein
MGEGIAIGPDDLAVLPAEAIDRSGATPVLKCRGSACAQLLSGACAIYPQRPRSCHEYPWYNFAGKVYYDAGCPGIQHDIDERPTARTISDMRRFFGFSKTLTRAFLLLARMW